jgi:predicted dehydrogenase
MIKVGICGFGYWGPVLCRNFSQNPKFQVVAVADKSKASRDRARGIDNRLQTFDDAIEMIDNGGIDAVVVATPVATHFAIAAHALRKGKHVLVEKPLCERSEEGRELVELARRNDLALLVDHVFLFHGAVRMLKELLTGDKIGQVSYFDSLRINLGLFQPDVNVLWDLAPHDFSIMDFLLEEEPAFIEATGYYHVKPQLPDIVYVTAHYESRMIAHLNLSWMSPVKVRRVAIGGSKQMVVWDDMNSEERLKIYNSGIELRPEEQRHIHYRIGDIYSPRIPGVEALAGVVEEFARAITGDKTSIIDGTKGVRVVRMLEAAQAALDRSLRTAQASLSKAGAVASRQVSSKAVRAS